MFALFRKFLANPNQETIDIFEKETKIEYDSKLFLSLRVLSLTHSQLRNLLPLSVFTNVEVLNLAHNKIINIAPLESMTHLKVIDLRFNEIRELPPWVYSLNKPLYWLRIDEEKEGIYLEGNPLTQDIIFEIKKDNEAPTQEKKIPSLPPRLLETKNTIKIESLKPLNTQHLAIFLPQENPSVFVKESVSDALFIDSFGMNLRINISLFEYDKNDELLNNLTEEFSKNTPYILLILKDRECCFHPRLLEFILKEYTHSKLFLIIEGNQSNIEEKINFFKTYGASKNILDIFHSFSTQSNKEIREKIFAHIQLSQEVNSLWKQNWIALKEEIEMLEKSKIDFFEYQRLADTFAVSTDVREYLFNYLKKVGSIKY